MNADHGGIYEYGGLLYRIKKDATLELDIMHMTQAQKSALYWNMVIYWAKELHSDAVRDSLAINDYSKLSQNMKNQIFLHALVKVNGYGTSSKKMRVTERMV